MEIRFLFEQAQRKALYERSRWKGKYLLTGFAPHALLLDGQYGHDTSMIGWPETRREPIGRIGSDQLDIIHTDPFTSEENEIDSGTQL